MLRSVAATLAVAALVVVATSVTAVPGTVARPPGHDDVPAPATGQDNRAPAVSMWWRDRDPGLRLGDNHFQQRRFTPAFARQLQAAGAVVVGHSLNDSQHIARFEALGVSVYTDGPYADKPSAATLPPPGAPGEPLP